MLRLVLLTLLSVTIVSPNVRAQPNVGVPPAEGEPAEDPRDGEEGAEPATRGADVDWYGDGPVPEVDEPDELGAEDDAEDDRDAYASDVRAPRGVDPGRSGSTVTRRDLEERRPRSAPDALRFEPGVFVQQTSQAQGSAFLRGRTGQQTVLLFDDVRLNNSLFRQGPNQYFFTIDARTIDSIDVVRGSASTRWGSDAIGGVIHARPIDPVLDPGNRGLRVAPRGMLRGATADGERGGRAQVELQVGPRFGVIAGTGYRHVGLLESAGPVLSPRGGDLPEVPRFDRDGRTQLGTGFREWTGDARAVARLKPDLNLIVAWYDYRQFDAPRTDQCPAAFAPFDECLVYDEQFRTLGYAALEGHFAPRMRNARWTASWQRQHELRTQNRPSSFVRNSGRDDVNSFGTALRAQGRRHSWADGKLGLLVRYGGDAYMDRVSSKAWLEYTDLDILRFRSRGQYLDGSSYVWGGAFAEAELAVGPRVVLRWGSRLSHIRANAPADVESGTAAVDAAWTPVVANAGLEVRASRFVTLFANADQGYRAPNLDDLTSRQQTGPGFQFENAGLRPEVAWTFESGVRWWRPFASAEVSAFRSNLRHAIARSSRNVGQCPPLTPQCGSSWSRFQLVNLDGIAVIHGVEASGSVRLPFGFEMVAMASWARGEGDNPSPRPSLGGDN
jgi:outer membrane receptor protein involved in Fe transport